VLEAGCRKYHRRPQHRLPLGCELRVLLVAASADSLRCDMRRSKCDQAMHLALPPSHWPVLLMIYNGQNPGPSTSGTSHIKLSKMPPPTLMHLWTHCRVLSVARRSSWRRSFIRTQALLMRATRSAHVFNLVRYTPPSAVPIKRNPKLLIRGNVQVSELDFLRQSTG